jgi:hypothetical protein
VAITHAVVCETFLKSAKSLRRRVRPAALGGRQSFFVLQNAASKGGSVLVERATCSCRGELAEQNTLLVA